MRQLSSNLNTDIAGALFDATGSYLYSLLVCVGLYLITCLLLVWCAYRFRRARRAQVQTVAGPSGASEEDGDKAEEEGIKEVYVIDEIMTTV